MTTRQLEIIILKAQIDAINHLRSNFTFEDLSDYIGELEWFWNELEEKKENLLLEEVYEKAPNYETLIKERLS